VSVFEFIIAMTVALFFAIFLFAFSQRIYLLVWCKVSASEVERRTKKVTVLALSLLMSLVVLGIVYSLK
jgi:hypothetical protein